MTDSTTALMPYDFETAEIRQVGLVLAGQAEALVITDDETDLAAKTVLALVTKGLRQAKTRHDEVKEQPLAECNAIDARAKAEAEAAAAQARGEEPAPTPEPEPAAPLPAIPVTQAVTRTEAGTVGMVKTRGYKVVDESKIPREYWLLDVARIAREYKSGGDVPGCAEDITYAPRTR